MTENTDRGGGPMRLIWRLIFWSAVLAFFVLIAAGIGAWAAWRHFSENLPEITSLKDYRPPLVTRVLADDGRKIAEFYRERRILTPLEEMPDHLINAFVSAEDARFYEHPGVDLKSIVRAAIRNFEAGGVVQGGSTITQQVVKSFLLSPEKLYERKIKEAILAWRIEKRFSKKEILYLYLNQIYLGHGAYGVGAAAENYFGKPVKDLSLAECALLAGLPQAPSKYSPFHAMEKARTRQSYVLGRMVIDGYIIQEDADEAEKEALVIRPRRNFYRENAPNYAEHVRRYVEKNYGEDLLYTGGLTIYTAVNIPMQKMARKAIEKGLRDLDKRHAGYRGPFRNVAEEKRKAVLEELSERPPYLPEPAAGDICRGLVTGVQEKSGQVLVDLGFARGKIPFSKMKWAVKRAERKAKSARIADAVAPGDLIETRLEKQDKKTGGWILSLEQPPMAESAILCVEAGSGMVKAMVGGKDFSTSKFNRAIQARRQPGSAFKPIVYTAALDSGYTPATEILDTAFVLENTTETWMPKNYDRTFHGSVLVRRALARSMNLPTINIVRKIGVDRVIEYARKLGIESEMGPNLSLALGSTGVSLLELTNVYAVFANGGNRIAPVFVLRVEDRDGNVLEEAASTAEPVLSPDTAYLATSLLETVVNAGTATSIKALGRPVAGKTGTTNDLRDAWFMGFTRDFITGVWVGYDQERPLGKRETGGRAAAPIWLDFMTRAQKDLPIRGFEAPEGIVFAKIDAKTGLLPAPDSQKIIFECFKDGTVPTRRTPSAANITDTGQLLKLGM